MRWDPFSLGQDLFALKSNLNTMASAATSWKKRESAFPIHVKLDVF